MRERERETYSTKTKTRNKAFVEEAIGEESNSWASVDNGENIVELEWSFSWSMMGLQIPTKKLSTLSFIFLRLNSNI